MPNTILPAIQQRLRADAESICFKCFHRKVCRAIDNQPCIECNQFTDANGVTVQQWIPVAERLPVKAGKYLTVVKSVLGDGDNYIRLLWYGHGFHYSDPDIGDVQMNKYVTHWMPLPQPPEGE